MIDPIKLLTDELREQSLRSLAKQIGCSASYLSDVMNRKLPAGPVILDYLKLDRHDSYVYVSRTKR